MPTTSPHPTRTLFCTCELVSLLETVVLYKERPLLHVLERENYWTSSDLVLVYASATVPYPGYSAAAKALPSCWNNTLALIAEHAAIIDEIGLSTGFNVDNVSKGLINLDVDGKDWRSGFRVKPLDYIPHYIPELLAVVKPGTKIVVPIDFNGNATAVASEVYANADGLAKQLVQLATTYDWIDGYILDCESLALLSASLARFRQHDVQGSPACCLPAPARTLTDLVARIVPQTRPTAATARQVLTKGFRTSPNASARELPVSHERPRACRSCSRHSALHSTRRARRWPLRRKKTALDSNIGRTTNRT